MPVRSSALIESLARADLVRFVRLIRTNLHRTILILDRLVNRLEPSIPLPRRLPACPGTQRRLISLISQYFSIFSATLRANTRRNELAGSAVTSKIFRAFNAA
jgi:hypothetical protein